MRLSPCVKLMCVFMRSRVRARLRRPVKAPVRFFFFSFVFTHPSALQITPCPSLLHDAHPSPLSFSSVCTGTSQAGAYTSKTRSLKNAGVRQA